MLSNSQIVLSQMYDEVDEGNNDLGDANIDMVRIINSVFLFMILSELVFSTNFKNQFAGSVMILQ